VYTYPNIAQTPLVSDAALCPGQSVMLVVSSSGNIFWFPAATSSDTLHIGSTYLVTPATSVTYYVQAEDSGCVSVRVPVDVIVDDCDSVFIPNVFTPNNDGLNDLFRFTVPVNQCFHAKIYNRWGKLLYEWDDAAGGWDGTNQDNGKKVSDGVYYYILRYCNSDMAYRYAHGFLEVSGE
jgi:gliding motility-associated-like protein